jgi:hypothetical protein
MRGAATIVSMRRTVLASSAAKVRRFSARFSPSAAISLRLSASRSAVSN